MSTCLIIALGNDGEALPVIALGYHLKQRGHRVILISACIYEDRAKQASIEFIGLSSQTEYQQRTRDTWILNSRYALLFAIRHCFAWNRVIYSVIASHKNDDLILVAVDHGLLFSDLLAYQYLKLPLIRISLEPPAIANAHSAVPFLSTSTVQNMLGTRAGDLFASFMREHNLPLDKKQLHEFIEIFEEIKSIVPVAALWPQWLTSHPSADNVRNFGFLKTSWTSNNQKPSPMEYCSDEVLIFIAGTRGTTAGWAKQFFSVSTEVCVSLQIKGVLLGGNPKDIPELPVEVSYSAFAPIDDFITGARAIVHHGGIGTAARAIAAGIPQLLVPRVHMQLSNAEWLRRLGIATILNQQSYSRISVIAEIRKLMHDPYQKRCTELRELFNRQHAVEADICEFVASRGMNKCRPT